MGKLVVTEFITADGVIDDPGGVEGFERGGWAFEYDRGDVGNQFKFDEILEAEVQLLGRTTLVDNDLVDQLRLMVFPVVLGAGERLFAETAAPKSLRLVDSKPANDCLILTYEAAASKD